MKDESINMQAVFSESADSSQTIITQNRDKLPKFTLRKGDDFYLSREQISDLNDSYFQMLADMDEGNGSVPAEIRSYMESVIFASYVHEVNKMQLENKLDGDVERERRETLNAILSPRWWRSWFFRKKRNHSAMLFDELVSRQARQYHLQKENELPQLEMQEGQEPEPYSIQLEILKELLPRRMRKNKRAEIEEIIESLAVAYSSKVASVQRLEDELQVEREKVIQMTNEAQQEAVKRLASCLNAIAEKKKPLDWAILRPVQEVSELEVEADEIKEQPADDEYWGYDEPDEAYE